MDAGLSDFTVWITGASGGIGCVLAESFASEGARLVLHAGRNAKALHGWAEDLGERAMVDSADVTRPEDVDALAARAVERFGRIDACIVNAGVWPAGDVPLHEMTNERIRHVVDVNLLGAMWTARAFLASLAATGPRSDERGAALTFIGSTAGRFGEARHAEYAATKAALYGLMRSLKNEIVALDPYARVNMVEPGWTVTPMAEAALEQASTVQQVVATMPVRQLARPQDIASAVVWLSSPELARHVSGEVVTVAGGMEGRQQWSPADVDAARIRARVRGD